MVESVNNAGKEQAGLGGTSKDIGRTPWTSPLNLNREPLRDSAKSLGRLTPNSVLVPCRILAPTAPSLVQSPQGMRSLQ
jgi:hypothetical protein